MSILFWWISTRPIGKNRAGKQRDGGIKRFPGKFNEGFLILGWIQLFYETIVIQVYR